MKLKTGIYCLVLLAGVFSAASAGESKIKESKNGVFSQIVVDEKGLFLKYVVDVKTQLCFAYAGNGTMNPIPCENLATREEWKSTIVWVK